VVLFFGSLCFFVSAIPFLLGEAITFEAAVVCSLSFFGIHSEPALAFALLVHIIICAASTIIALLVLPEKGLSCLKGLNFPNKESRGTLNTFIDNSPEQLMN
jgi:predicted permease